jgi:hypothetical protein
MRSAADRCRRHPDAPAAAYLLEIARRPEAVKEALQAGQKLPLVRLATYGFDEGWTSALELRENHCRQRRFALTPPPTQPIPALVVAPLLRDFVQNYA